MPDVNGSVEPGFEPVREVFERQFTAGEHVGAGVAVFSGGRKVVDLWGGVADEATGAPWEEDTLAVSFSTTKGITATCVHVLADRGALAYGDRVAKYWPEFAQNGKQDITVYHLLTHQAGIPQIPDDIAPDDINDWDRMVRAMESLSPEWEPGTASGYHAMNFGWLCGELIRRVDGRPIRDFLQDEICKPLGLTQMHIGTPESLEPKIAINVSKIEVTPESEQIRGAMATAYPLMARSLSPRGGEMDLNTPAAHQAQIPAVNGAMSARDLARFYACLANYGELDGVRLLKESTVRAMSEQQTFRPDKVIVMPVAWSLGYMNGAPGWPQGPRSTAFGHPGFGGSIGFADPEIGMSFGLVLNALTLGLTGAGRGSSLADAARACVERRD